MNKQPPQVFAYLHHRASDRGPFLTESVPYRADRFFESMKATNQGRVRTPHLVLYNARWRRVYQRHMPGYLYPQFYIGGLHDDDPEVEVVLREGRHL